MVGNVCKLDNWHLFYEFIEISFPFCSLLILFLIMQKMNTNEISLYACKCMLAFVISN